MKAFALVLLAALAGPVPVLSAKPPAAKAAFSAGAEGPRVALETLRKDGELYLQVRSLAKAYGGSERWLPASKRVVWTLGGRGLELRLGSAEAKLGKKRLKLPRPVASKGGKAFLPLAFVTGRDFASFSGRSSRWDEGSQTLSAERRSTVGGLRVYSYNDRTRVELEAARSAKPRLRKVSDKAYEVLLPGLVVEREETKKVKDDWLAAAELRQSKGRAVLRLRLEKAARVTLGFAGEPPRLLVDLLPAHAKKAPAGPEPKGPSSIAPPVLPGLSEALPPPKAPPASPEAVISSPEPPASPKAAAVAEEDEEEDEDEEEADAGAAQPIEPLQPAAPAARRPVIVVDAGHGGKDSGAIGPGRSMEKDVTLAVAKELAEVLRREGRFKVVLTRDRDVFVELSERSRIANAERSDLFISIHCNAARNKKMNGVEIYFLSENASDPWAKKVADFENAVVALEAGGGKESPAASVLHDMERVEFINEGSALSALMSKEIARRTELRSRGVKQAGFYVLRGTMAPSILVETGFITNPEEMRRLTSPRFRERMVEGIYAGILKYAKLKNWDY